MGVDWSLREGYAWAEDKEHCEEYGRMLQADPNKVSARAKKRGLPQVTRPLEGRGVHFFPYFVFVGVKNLTSMLQINILPVFFTVYQKEHCLFLLCSYSLQNLSGALQMLIK